MDSKLNVFFSFAAIFIFSITASNGSLYGQVGLGLFFSFIVSLAAFLTHQLSLDGLYSATIAGTIVYGIGGWPTALIMLFFFISSSAISNISESPAEDAVRRNGLQVWANGFWVAVFLLLYGITNESGFLIGALAAIAVATADTWSSELRSQNPDSTYLITTFESVSPGMDGGLSLQGTYWALAGSLVIAALSSFFLSLPLIAFFFIFIAGALGCMLDSFLGAALQQNDSPIVVPIIDLQIMFNNNMVNAISTGAGALAAIILKIIIL